MTDNDIIKALECCCKAKLNKDCKKLKCPFFDYEIDNCTNEGDMDAMYRFALDLIHHQQAEIERLNGCVKSEEEVRAIANATVQAGIGIIKAEAVKEFEERAIKNICEKVYAPTPVQSCIVEKCNQVIIETAKEMVGETNAE